ncbi:acetylxylan esterase, partial [Verrucomicrobia bacterium]|nr:acetylxylan esterase [Verrucomicrobiota bacterium]
CGGAALSQRRFGETVGRINRSFPHWFCSNFERYNDREPLLPFDQHFLIAAIAPRAVYVASASRDLWADPVGEYQSLYHAGKVYELYGEAGFSAPTPPAAGYPIRNGRMGYHIREGGHGLETYDWHRYMDFADSLWR